MTTFTYDIAIIGGGIVGLATAFALTSQVKQALIVLEAENHLAPHQTGHNSGVIHSGLYYKPGSLKAHNCVTGRKALLQFCQEHGIPYEQCGKLVVATREDELPALAKLVERGQANGLAGLRQLSAAEMSEYEPHAAGIAGLFVPETGIVDYSEVSRVFARLVEQAGGFIQTNTRVFACQQRSDELILSTTQGEVYCRNLINCGGLYSDRIARFCGVKPNLRIVPFRGEYYELVPERRQLVNNLIYPVPDPRFPFLGVHFTRRIGGEVEAGPNAVLAFKREGYTRTSFSGRDSWEIFSYPGFWRLAGQYWRMGLGEFYRSFSKPAFVKALQKLMPDIQASDLQPAGAGVRAQAMEASGFLVDDFRIIEASRAIHVLNAPSPAATASISIGQTIADMARRNFDLS